MSGLESGLPGTTTGPLSAPLRTASAESSRRPPLLFSLPWQSRHRLTMTGRTFVSKNSSSVRSASSPARLSPAAVSNSGLNSVELSESAVRSNRRILRPRGLGMFLPAVGPTLNHYLTSAIRGRVSRNNAGPTAGRYVFAARPLSCALSGVHGARRDRFPFKDCLTL